MSSQNSQGNKAIGIFLIILFVIFLTIPLFISFNAPVFSVFNSIINIIGIFITVVQIVPGMQKHFQALRFPRIKMEIVILSLLLVLSIVSNSVLLIYFHANSGSHSQMPPKLVLINPTPHLTATPTLPITATPTTATPTLPITATPTSPDISSSLLPIGQRPVINDPLKDNSGGYEWGSDPKCIFVNGQYYLSDTANGTGVACNTQSPNSQFSNFVYQIGMTILKDSSNDGNFDAGLTFRVGTTNNNNLYEVTFDVNGYWQVETAPSYDLLPNAPASQSCANPCRYFHQGLNKLNIITVRATGNNFQVQINGHDLGTFTDTSSNAYTSGFIGVQMSPGNQDGSVEFSTVRVWKL